MKRIVCFLLLLVLATTFVGAAEAPPLSVSAGDIAIPLVEAERLDVERYDAETVFFDVPAMEDIPYVALGTPVEILCHEAAPRDIAIYENVITQEGSFRYAQAPGDVGDFAFVYENGRISFDLPTNFYAFLSSNLEDYAQGSLLRGFILQCTIEDVPREFRFIIRSDTGFAGACGLFQ